MLDKGMVNMHIVITISLHAIYSILGCLMYIFRCYFDSCNIFAIKCSVYFALTLDWVRPVYLTLVYYSTRKGGTTTKRGGTHHIMIWWCMYMPFGLYFQEIW